MFCKQLFFQSKSITCSIKKTQKTHRRTEKCFDGISPCAGNEYEEGMVSTASLQPELSLSTNQALSPADRSLTAPSVALGPLNLCQWLFSLPYMLSPTIPSHLMALPHQADPSSHIASSREPSVTSRYIKSLLFWLGSTDHSDGNILGDYLIQICLHSYLSNVRVEAMAISLTIVLPMLPARPRTSRCSINTFIYSAHTF